ncbi:tetratricopeptide repeat protein [Carboxylicivirga sp. N1Y132]|uniref:Tetratricopeptide repeat protein n=2 Tax=Carboxylicivirga marina TaxID=2800988 RepID=A0ABS1HHN6_9BACT|nr:tetratricopeptide repeat protein [Carboxylicivirga marina]
MKIATLLIAGLLFTGSVFAQKGVEDGSKYGHGEDSLRCLENLSLYYEYYKQKNYAEAYPKWEIAFNECPASNKNLYSHGERIVESLYKKEKDAAKKAEYYKTLMLVYDQRAKYFGNDKRYPTAYIMGKKAITMLRYNRNNPDVIKEVQPLLEDGYKVLGVKTQPPALLTYMANSTAMYKMNELSGEKLVEIYTNVTTTLNKQKEMTKEANKPKIQEVINNVEKFFAQSGAANCETLAEIFGPQLADHTDDLAWLKRVNRLLTKGDCGESELFYQSSEYLHKIEPAASSAYGIALMYMKRGDTNKSVEFLNEAITLEEDASFKAKYHNTLGLIYMSQKKYSQTRAEARKAIALRGDWGAPYILIGKSYAATASSYGSTEFEHKTVYWAAVDQFKKAKSVDAEALAEANENILLYSQYFPNTEEIFFQGLKIGDAYKIAGWINTSTTVRAKK